MPELILPDAGLYIPWQQAHEEWGPGRHEDGFGLLPDDDVGSPSGFSRWVAGLLRDDHCSYRWLVEDGSVLGGIALRHDSHPLVRRMGHLGYGVRPTARGRGLAGWAVGLMLEEARLRGMDRVIAVCERSNYASARTLKSQGGVLMHGRDSEAALHYFFKLP